MEREFPKYFNMFYVECLFTSDPTFNSEPMFLSPVEVDCSFISEGSDYEN